MSETASTKRRVLRRTVTAAAVIVLLPFVYVGSWLGFSRAVNTGVVGVGVGESFLFVFKPLIVYCDSQKPGTDTLYRLWWSISANEGASREQQPGWFLSPSLPPPN